LDHSLAHPTVDEAARRIVARNHLVRAVLTPLLDEARAQDAALRAEAPRTVLHRVPYVLKDCWDTAGIRTTAGSWRHRTRIPANDSAVHTALEEAGAILVGKSNVSDLALAPESDNWLQGPTATPHDLSRASGGSTGGAAAVADGQAAFDWGSDFGGSIRMPAGFCGVVGIRLSSTTWPIVDFFPALPAELSSLNGMGPIATTIDGVRTILRTVAPRLRKGTAPGFEARGLAVYAPDRWTEGEWTTFADDVERSAKKAGVPIRSADDVPRPFLVNAAFDGFVAANFDAMVRSGEMDLGEGIGAVLSAITIGRALGDKRIHPNTAEILALLALGHVTIYRDKAKAQHRVDGVRRAARRLWDEGLLLVAPTATHPPPPHGQVQRTRGMLAFTKFGNLLDATAVAFPFGTYPNGLPRSLQILGPPGSEDAVLNAAELLRIAGRSRPASS